MLTPIKNVNTTLQVPSTSVVVSLPLTSTVLSNNNASNFHHDFYNQKLEPLNNYYQMPSFNNQSASLYMPQSKFFIFTLN